MPCPVSPVKLPPKGTHTVIDQKAALSSETIRGVRLRIVDVASRRSLREFEPRPLKVCRNCDVVPPRHAIPNRGAVISAWFACRQVSRIAETPANCR